MKKKIIHYIIIVASCMSILALGSGCDASKTCGNCLGHGCSNCIDSCSWCMGATCVPVCNECADCVEGCGEGYDEATGNEPDYTF